MGNLIKNLLKVHKIDSLEQENLALKEQLRNCSDKLIERQEHINTTNAYWKKKMHLVNSKKSNKKEL